MFRCGKSNKENTHTLMVFATFLTYIKLKKQCLLKKKNNRIIYRYQNEEVGIMPWDNLYSVNCLLKVEFKM